LAPSIAFLEDSLSCFLLRNNSNENTSKVSYLGPTIAGKTHDKKAADTASIVYPSNATLDKDTGFQGYEPAGILTAQPKKSRKARP